MSVVRVTGSLGCEESTGDGCPDDGFLFDSVAASQAGGSQCRRRSVAVCDRGEAVHASGTESVTDWVACFADVKYVDRGGYVAQLGRDSIGDPCATEVCVGCDEDVHAGCRGGDEAEDGLAGLAGAADDGDLPVMVAYRFGSLEVLNDEELSASVGWRKLKALVRSEANGAVVAGEYRRSAPAADDEWSAEADVGAAA